MLVLHPQTVVHLDVEPQPPNTLTQAAKTLFISGVARQERAEHTFSLKAFLGLVFPRKQDNGWRRSLPSLHSKSDLKGRQREATIPSPAASAIDLRQVRGMNWLAIRWGVIRGQAQSLRLESSVSPNRVGLQHTKALKHPNKTHRGYSVTFLVLPCTLSASFPHKDTSDLSRPSSPTMSPA